MADIELKTSTPDTTIDDNAFLVGADSQSATAPSMFAVSTLIAHLLQRSNTWTGAQTFSSTVAFDTAPNVGGSNLVTEANAVMDSEVTNLAAVKAFDPTDYATAAQGDKADSAQQPPAEGAFVDGDKTKLDGVETGADVTDTANVTAAGALMDGEVTNLAAVKAFDPTDYAPASHSHTLSGITDSGALAAKDTVAAGDIDANAVTEAKLDALDTPSDAEVLSWNSASSRFEWVAQTGGGGASATDTSEGVVELATVAEINTGTDTARAITPAGLAGSALQTKLDAIEAGADVTDTANVTAAGALMDGEVTNLAAVKAFDSADYATAAQGAKADSAQQPPTEGAFVDGDKTKLNGIETGADVTDTANVTAAGALMDGEVTNLAAVKALNQGVATTDSPTFADGTTVGTSRLFPTLTDLLATTETFTEADTLVAFAEGFTYTVAASGASDHHLTTAGGDKLYVTTADNFLAWNADNTGTTDCAAALKQFIEYNSATGSRGRCYVPAGNYRLSSRVEATLGGVTGLTFEGAGRGATRFVVDEDNIDGGIKITRSWANQALHCRDFDCISNIGSDAGDLVENIFLNDPAGGIAAYWGTVGTATAVVDTTVPDPFDVRGNVIDATISDYGTGRLYKDFAGVAASSAEAWSVEVYIKTHTGTQDVFVNLYHAGSTGDTSTRVEVNADGWTRIHETDTTGTATGTNRNINIWLPSGETADLHIACVQVHAGSDPVNYIPTTTAAVESNKTNGTALCLTSDIGTSLDGETDDAGWGALAKQQVVVERVHVGGSGEASGQWNYGIFVEYAWYPVVNNCVTAINHNSNKLTPNPTLYQQGAGICFRQCYAPGVDRSIVDGRWEKGIYIYGVRNNANDQDFEDAYVQNSFIAKLMLEGIVVDHLHPEQANNILSEPGLTITGNHIHAHQTNIRITNHFNIRIMDNNIALALPPAQQYIYTNETGVLLQNVTDCEISGNQFWDLGYYTSLTDCTRCIVIDDESDHVIVQGNRFGVKGIGVLSDSAEDNVQIGENAWTAQIAGAELVANGPNKRVHLTGTGKLAEYGGGQSTMVRQEDYAETIVNAVDYTGIPEWARRLTLTISGMSCNNTDEFQLRLGDSGGIETSGYTSSAHLGNAAVETTTNGFQLTAGSAAADGWSGVIELIRHDETTWALSSQLLRSGDGNVVNATGIKSLSAALTQINIVTSAGNTIDAGTVTMYAS